MSSARVDVATTFKRDQTWGFDSNEKVVKEIDQFNVSRIY